MQLSLPNRSRTAEFQAQRLPKQPSARTKCETSHVHSAAVALYTSIHMLLEDITNELRLLTELHVKRQQPSYSDDYIDEDINHCNSDIRRNIEQVKAALKKYSELQQRCKGADEQQMLMSMQEKQSTAVNASVVELTSRNTQHAQQLKKQQERWRARCGQFSQMSTPTEDDDGFTCEQESSSRQLVYDDSALNTQLDLSKETLREIGAICHDAAEMKRLLNEFREVVEMQDAPIQTIATHIEQANASVQRAAGDIKIARTHQRDCCIM